MSKQRIIKDEIWDDEWFFDLDPSEKLVWLFLLTNSRGNIAGIYTLNRRWASITLGFDRNVIDVVLARFEADKKVKIVNDWLIICNFHKHQSSNPKVELGVVRIIENLPKEVLSKIDYDSLCIAYPTLLNSTLLNSTLLNLTEGAVKKRKAAARPKVAVANKQSFGEDDNVKLTEDEYNNLVADLGDGPTTALITELDQYISSKGKDPYKSHKATIKAWFRRKLEDHAKRGYKGSQIADV